MSLNNIAKLALVLCLLPAAQNVLAQGRRQQETPRVIVEGFDYTNVSISTAQVRSEIEAIVTAIKEQEEGGIPSAKFIAMQRKMNYYRHYPDIEHDTTIKKGWFQRLGEILDYMRRAKDASFAAVMRGDTQTQGKAAAAYKEAGANFLKLASSPERLSPEEHQRLVEQKKQREANKRRR